MNRIALYAFLIVPAALLAASGRPLLAAGGQFVVTVVDRDTREPIACRMHLKTAAGKSRRAGDTPYWHDHFVVPGQITLKLPLGLYAFVIERGPEYVDRNGHFTIERYADDAATFDLRRFVDMTDHGWWAGDFDIRRRVHDVELLMQAEDLHVAQVVTWSNDRRTSLTGPAADNPFVTLDDSRFYHAMAGAHERAGGEWLFFNLPKPLLWTGKSAEYPPPTQHIDQARQHEGAWIDLACPYAWDLPMLVACDGVDSIQLAPSQLCRDTVRPASRGARPRDRTRYPGTWGDAQWAQAVYFHLLNCGLRIPPSAGSGSGRAPNPVGYNRVYVQLDGELTYEKWFQGLRAGRVTVTNGPLLRPSVEGHAPGHVFRSEENQPLELEIALTLSTREPITYLDIIKDGKVEHSVPLREYAKTGKLPKIRFDRSGWFLVRATTDLQDTYRFAMTGPYYVEFDYQPTIHKESARFFLDWVYERARQLDVDDPAQRAEVIAPHRRARDFWQDLVDRATVE